MIYGAEPTNEFLEDLARVFNKHRMYIDGCGCCGSPYFVGLEKTETVRCLPENFCGDVSLDCEVDNEQT